MTNNKLNVNSINGSLALTVLSERFFDGEYTSATIVSKKSFNLTESEKKLIIKFRAAFRTDLGIYPHIRLMPDRMIEFWKINYDSESITYRYEYDNIWNGFRRLYENTNGTETKNMTDKIDVHQFQNYQFQFYNNTFKWILNQKEYFRNELIFEHHEDPSGEHQMSLIVDNLENFVLILNEPLRFVITVFVDERNREKLPYFKYLDCSSLILDYLIVEELDEFNFEKIPVATKFSVSEINNVCNQIEWISVQQRENDFMPNTRLKLVWQDEFEGSTLNESLWNFMVHQNKCESN